MGIGFASLEHILAQQFKKKGDAVVAENLGVARAAYEYDSQHFEPFASLLPTTERRYAVLTGNMALAMRGAAAA
jgi:hypothetical protein